MAETLKQKLDIDAELIEGEKGVFDVVADGQLVFSKHAEGRFPDEQEILDSLGPLLADKAGQ